ncbi:MAG: M23 family metallopeptidase [Bacteroidia bacterium]|nr:M23 family metallopeptidase [Bacteroidia bacterium]
MKNYLMSVALVAIGTFFMSSENLKAVFPTSKSKQNLADGQEPGGMMKIQQAHLRTIDPFDIDIVPTSRPIPKGVPLGSVFGMRKHPILGVDKMHQGVDFPAPSGTPVLATATGKVGWIVNSADSSSYGKYVKLIHDEEYCTLYAHLSGIVVTPGQIVEEGDTLGFVGTTGRSTNPHLHYEVIMDGEHLDPEDFF